LTRSAPRSKLRAGKANLSSLLAVPESSFRHSDRRVREERRNPFEGVPRLRSGRQS
jgi:hypothetical protein